MERIHIFNKTYFSLPPTAMRLKRIRRGEYVLEQLFVVNRSESFIFSWKIRLGLRGASCRLSARWITGSETAEWTRKNLEADDGEDILRYVQKPA